VGADGIDRDAGAACKFERFVEAQAAHVIAAVGEQHQRRLTVLDASHV
jgi:hypothetical protein